MLKRTFINFSGTVLRFLFRCVKIKKMSSLKSGETIQKKEGGPDRSVSDNIWPKCMYFGYYLHFCIFNKKKMLSIFFTRNMHIWQKKLSYIVVE